MISPEEARKAYEQYGSIRKASKKLGVPRTTFRRALNKSFEEEAQQTEEEESQIQLKVRRQEKKIQSLSKELKKAQDELLTTEQVRNHILGIKEIDDGSLPEWTFPSNTQEPRTNIPCTIWSDWHFGEVVSPKQVFGLNEYNLAIAKERVSNLISNTFWLFDEHLAPRNYPGLVLCLGGDMVSGTIHEELTETNEQDIMPIMLDLYQHLRSAILTMSQKFGNVFLPCVIGNHGRTTKKPSHKNAAYKNYDWLLYHLLADYFKDHDNISFLIGDDDEVTFEVLGHVYRCTHGSQFRGGSGFIGPLAPITRGEHKKRIVSQSQGTVYDTLLMGHFHQCIWRPRLIVSGSLKGYDEFAADNNLEFEPPKQMAWLTDEKYGKVSPLEVWAEEPDKSFGVETFKQVTF